MDNVAFSTENDLKTIFSLQSDKDVWLEVTEVHHPIENEILFAVVVNVCQKRVGGQFLIRHPENCVQCRNLWSSALYLGNELQFGFHLGRSVLSRERIIESSKSPNGQTSKSSSSGYRLRLDRGANQQQSNEKK